MPQSLSAVYIHLVFSTKDRRPLLRDKPTRDALHSYLGGVSKQLDCPPLLVGGVEDHVHVLLSIPSTLSVAKSIQLLKGNSSKWVHDTFKEHWDFQWQEGYGAFSIGISGVEETTKYIQGQAEHHRRMTFRQELEVFLKKHGMEYVERDLE
jgi:REP element-mobilizing transposase RayT